MSMEHIEAKLPTLTMEDDLGIVYLIESAQQFWSELEDVLRTIEGGPPTLSLLDATLRRFLTLCATYHGTCKPVFASRQLTNLCPQPEQYLQSPLQLEHACGLLLDSDLFQFHSERMCDIIVNDSMQTTDPHSTFIFFQVLFCFGRRRSDVFRNAKRWQSLLPLLIDHVLVEIDPDVEDTYAGTAVGRSASFSSVPIPIEAKLRTLSVKLLYEICRVQTLSMADLKIFDDAFIDYLFDLVEQTRDMHDETFNYSVIRLLISLNEQFMVASLGDQTKTSETKNRVLRVMMRRFGSCKTFGQNMIFMLNRAKRTPDDLCMTLLILKLLYVLFSTKGTAEYFYTNDLCVLVDVFLREITDLDEDSEALRHTYLRVLHPLLTKTQLRDVPYKRPQLLVMLESLTSSNQVRELNPTTKRLAERCLTGEWCIQLMELRQEAGYRPTSPSSETSASILSPQGVLGPNASTHLEPPNKVMKSLKFSKSVEHLSSTRLEYPKAPMPRSPLDQIRRPSNASMQSLPGSLSNGPAKPSIQSSTKRRSASSTSDQATVRPTSLDGSSLSASTHQPPPVPPIPSPTNVTAAPPIKHRRPPPPAPVKRRRPPAIPVSNGITITTIRSSEPSPLSKVHTPPIGVQGAAS